MVLLAAFGRLTVGQAAPPQIFARPLTHQEIHDFALPEGTRPSGGLFTVGVGEPVYLEAVVDKGTVVSNVVWSVSSRPAGSTVALAPSPLGSGIPIYNPGDRGVLDVASRRLLVPDAAGNYMITARVTTSTNELVVARHVTAAHYVGVGTIDGAMPRYPQCGLCHVDKAFSWQGTGHATMFSEAIDGLKSSFYNASCIECHTVGYNTNALANNGGFDDVAAQVGWTFPATLQPGNWASMTNRLKQFANIQCENCHGPGSEHHGISTNITVSFSSGDCAQCHDEKPYHIKNAEWNNSKHAVTTRYPTGPTRSSCVGCHSGIGFVDRIDGKATLRTDYEAITCASCHDPHLAANPHQIRTLADVTLMDNITTITNGGKGKLCMQCHKSRRNAVTYVTRYASHFGPHYGPQADMLAGANAIQYGKAIPSSRHLQAVPDSCVTCHMQATARTDPVHTEAGGHTFKPKWDGGTPNDPSDDVSLVGACQSCHGPITTFNFPRHDYDGNGIIEGVQTEVAGLMRALALKLPPIGQPTVSVTAAYTAAQLKAAYNYLFVYYDGSKGVHNAPYAVGILKASIADLDIDPNDTDGDGLPDAWEITHFGSIQSMDGRGDADGDGLSNALEWTLGTNPNAADSDNDGFTDRIEVLAGSDPNNAQDLPALRARIYTAAEFEFVTEPGKTYQIQAVTEVDGAWQNLGNPIVGTGDMMQRYFSTRTETQRFFRVIEVP